MKKILLLLILVLAGCSSSKTTKPVKPIQEISPVIVESFYKIESSLSWIKEAVRIADCATKNKDFHREILSVESYEHYEGEAKAIVESLVSPTIARVGTYSKRFTKARAYRKVGDNKIWVNRKKISKADAAFLNTMVHERLHVLGYKHKGNDRYQYNNENSVPYKVGRIAQNYFEVCK
jgi:hypothetical protein